MENTTGVSLQDYLSLLRRRRAFMSWVFLGVLLAVTLGTFLFPEKYRSSTLIYIEKPQIREDIVQTTVPNYDTDLRIDRITDQVLSRSSLQPLIDEFSLYPNLPPEERASEMRDDVKVDKILNTDQPAIVSTEQTIGFEVGFKYASPEKAQAVASKLGHMFVQRNAANRTATVTETSDFLNQQADTLKAELARTEAALAKFKQEHAGSLPEDSTLNQQMLDRTERDLDNTEENIRTVQARKDLLITQLAQTSPSAPLYDENGKPILGAEDQLESLRRQYVELSAKYSPQHPDLIRLRKQIELLSKNQPAGIDRTAIQSELDTKREELKDLQRRYSPDYPDVKELKRTITALTRQLAAQPAASSTNTRAPDNPAYLQLQVQLDSADADLAAMQADRQKLRKKIDDLQAQIAREPQTEKELITVSRDYDIAKQDYNKIREKQTAAHRAIAVEDEQKAERYVLQRDAYLPSSPAQPSHLTIILAGMFLAVSASIGSALFRDAVDGTVRGARDLRMIVKAPPMAVIPTIMNGRETWKHRMRRLALAASYVGVAFLAITAAA